MNADERRFRAKRTRVLDGARGDISAQRAFNCFVAVRTLLYPRSRPEGTRFICGFILILCSVARSADLVERRGDEPAVRGNVVQVDEAGVRIRSETGAAQTISWDRVRRVEASSALEQEKAAAYEQLAQDLWRARARLERGDTSLAEPVFEQYFERYKGGTSETALVVVEGYLRCLLAREARVFALVPALETARLRAAGVETISYSARPPAIDEQTLLCPALPPVWTGMLGLPALERDLGSYDAKENETIAAIASLYLRSVRRDMGRGEQIESDRARGARHAGVELLRDLVVAMDARDDGRRAARVRLERRINDSETAGGGDWAEAWARYAVGRSLLDERHETQRRRGLLSMAHVPARFGASQPYLAGLALDMLSAAGDLGVSAQAAGSLRAELERRYPRHPVLHEGFSPVWSQENESD